MFSSISCLRWRPFNWKFDSLSRPVIFCPHLRPVFSVAFALGLGVATLQFGEISRAVSMLPSMESLFEKLSIEDKNNLPSSRGGAVSRLVHKFQQRYDYLDLIDFITGIEKTHVIDNPKLRSEVLDIVRHSCATLTLDLYQCDYKLYRRSIFEDGSPCVPIPPNESWMLCSRCSPEEEILLGELAADVRRFRITPRVLKSNFIELISKDVTERVTLDSETVEKLENCLASALHLEINFSLDFVLHSSSTERVKKIIALERKEELSTISIYCGPKFIRLDFAEERYLLDWHTSENLADFVRQRSSGEEASTNSCALLYQLLVWTSIDDEPRTIPISLFADFVRMIDSLLPNLLSSGAEGLMNYLCPRPTLESTEEATISQKYKHYLDLREWDVFRRIILVYKANAGRVQIGNEKFKILASVHRALLVFQQLSLQDPLSQVLITSVWSMV